VDGLGEGGGLEHVQKVREHPWSRCWCWLVAARVERQWRGGGQRCGVTFWSSSMPVV